MNGIELLEYFHNQEEALAEQAREMRETNGLSRVLEALECHVWPEMQMKTSPEASSNGVSSGKYCFCLKLQENVKTSLLSYSVEDQAVINRLFDRLSFACNQPETSSR